MKISNLKHLPLVGLILIFVSCSEKPIAPEAPLDGTEIMSFTNQKALTDYWNEVKDLSPEELVLFEQNSGFKSLQRKTDEVMNRLAETSFKSGAELESFIIENAAFVKEVLMDGEPTLVRAHDETPAHLIANEDGMFLLEGKAHKLFNDGLVSASIDEIEQLKATRSFRDAATSGFNVEFEAIEDVNEANARVESGCPKNEERYSYSQDGKNRTTIQISIGTIYNLLNFRKTLQIKTQVMSHYKFATRWVPVKRTITGFF